MILKFLFGFDIIGNQNLTWRTSADTCNFDYRCFVFFDFYYHINTYADFRAFCRFDYIICGYNSCHWIRFPNFLVTDSRRRNARSLSTGAECFHGIFDFDCIGITTCDFKTSCYRQNKRYYCGRTCYKFNCLCPVLFHSIVFQQLPWVPVYR